MKIRAALLALLITLTSSAVWAQQAKLADPMRGPTPVGEVAPSPPMSPVQNQDIKRERAYSMQPPTIPHAIDKYQLDKNYNQCLSCHSRVNAAASQATPVSVTHYMDREGNVLAEVSPRRYFCTQCHVTQVESPPRVENTFQDIDAILKRSAAPAKKK